MKFDFQNILRRARQITWTHKNLWLTGIVISIVAFLFAPISLILNPAFSAYVIPADVNRQLPSVVPANLYVLLLAVLAIPIFVIGISIPSLGAFQVEQGNKNVHLGQLIRDVLPYFWRNLGIVLVVWVSMLLAAVILPALVILFSFLTLGLGLICAVPLFILLLLGVILGYALMEEGVSAVLVDHLGVASALRQAWELMKQDPGDMTLMSVLSYVVAIAAIMFISIPTMITMPGFMPNLGSELGIQSFERLAHNMIVWMLALLPFYVVFQGIFLTFTQSVWTLIYLRLTRATTPLQPLP